jgi:hypothetical protein
MAYRSRVSLLVAVGALVAFPFAAGLAVLILATCGAGFAGSMQRTSNGSQGQCDCGDE